MNNDSGALLIKGNEYHVLNKKKFIAFASMQDEDKKECFDFAYGMSYGKKGEHRDSRSGGQLHRTDGQIFINTFQGKMAEYALYRFLISRNIDVDKPDVEQYDLGKWDSYDLSCQGKKISIKSTKSFGNLLLLETKDWNENGEYKPNLSDGVAKYDYTVLARFSPDGEKIMSELGLLKQNIEDVSGEIKKILYEKICKQNWQYDFAGFIYHSELVDIIKKKQIIPQNSMLNGRVKMDAENYYIQAGDMHIMSELYTGEINSDMKTRMGLLVRKCPDCGSELVIRNGRKRFWGCTGYFNNPSCGFKESLDHKRF